MDELLKVPDSAIIADQKKIISKKDIEIGKLKSYVMELNDIIRNTPTIKSNEKLRKNNKKLKNKIIYLERELLNYKKAFELNKLNKVL